MDSSNDEVLFVGTADAEHVEMYLKAIWHIKERKEPVKISTIAKMLNIRQPSVVQMLKKLNGQQLVEYNKAGVFLTEGGERVGGDGTMPTGDARDGLVQPVERDGDDPSSTTPVTRN